MRRGRIVASVCAFVLCLGALVIGIYAAVTSANFTVSPSVNFNTKGVYVDIEGRVLRGADFASLEPTSEDASHTLSKQKNYVVDESGNPSGNKTVGTWSPKNVWFMGAEPVVSFELTITNHSLEPISVIPGDVTNLPTGVTLYEDTAETLYVKSEETKSLRMNYKVSDTATAFTNATIDMSFDFVLTSAITNPESDFTMDTTTKTQLNSINTNYNNPIYGQRVVVVPNSVNGSKILTMFDPGDPYSNGTFTNLSSETKYLILPNSLEEIAGFTLVYTSSVKAVGITSDIKSINQSAFYGCGSLLSIKIPASVTSIGNQAFASCDSLVSINIPEGVTRLEHNTFAACGLLASIIIPSSVTTIEDSVFSGCASLTSVYFEGLAPGVALYSFGVSWDEFQAEYGVPYTNPNFAFYVKSAYLSSYQQGSSSTVSTSGTSVNNWYYLQDKLTTY